MRLDQAFFVGVSVAILFLYFATLAVVVWRRNERARHYWRVAWQQIPDVDREVVRWGGRVLWLAVLIGAAGL